MTAKGTTTNSRSQAFTGQCTELVHCGRLATFLHIEIVIWVAIEWEEKVRRSDWEALCRSSIGTDSGYLDAWGLGFGAGGGAQGVEDWEVPNIERWKVEGRISMSINISDERSEDRARSFARQVQGLWKNHP